MEERRRIGLSPAERVAADDRIEETGEVEDFEDPHGHGVRLVGDDREPQAALRSDSRVSATCG